MSSKSIVINNLYQDSVSLMQLSALISKTAGIDKASVVMGTETNLNQLKDAGLDNNINAGPNDLIIAVSGDEQACDLALALAQEKLTNRPSSDQGQIANIAITSLEMAFEKQPNANFALISVPGDYAAAEAIKALNLGFNVMLFSDNVSPEEEYLVKTLAEKKSLLVMGPDCGTAIINGIPLGFANVVSSGKVGVIAASGTGLQEVSCRIVQLGEGISQALGTGGHDLSETIGGKSMLFSMSLLEDDPNTEIIVLISKPPATNVANQIIAKAKSINKPVVIHFLGSEVTTQQQDNLSFINSLVEAAEQAVSLIQTKKLKPFINKINDNLQQQLTIMSQQLNPTRRYIRGVFAGGTFCYESQLICANQNIKGYSNAPIKQFQKLTDLSRSQTHTFIDMGDDDFTKGKPHPMIDPSLRNSRIVQEIEDKQVAVILFDLVLGYGAADDPSSELITIINQVKSKYTDLPIFIAHVCGTEADPQVRSKQITALQQAGVIVADCNAQAALCASFIANLCNKN